MRVHDVAEAADALRVRARPRRATRSVPPFDGDDDALKWIRVRTHP